MTHPFRLIHNSLLAGLFFSSPACTACAAAPCARPGAYDRSCQRQLPGVVPHAEHVPFRLLGIPDVQGKPPSQPDAGPYPGTI